MPLPLCLWPLVHKRLLEAASSSSPAQISSDGASPSVRRGVLPPELSFESHLCGAVGIWLKFCSPVLLRSFWLDAEDHVSMMNGVGTASLLVKCFGSFPSERLCTGKWEAEVWIAVMPSLAKLPRLRPSGFNSKLFRFFSMGLWRTFTIFCVSNYEEITCIRLVNELS